MAWDVRPTSDLESSRRRRLDRPLLRRLAARRRVGAAVLEQSPLRPDARRVRRRPDRRRRRRLPVRADRSGRHRRVRRGDRRRCPADPSPPRDPDGDDASAARGRPGSRRADRRPLGLGGGHLPPLRLRPRLAGLRDGAPSGYAALREPRDDRATVRIAPLEESKDVFAAIYDRARLRTPGMFARTETWWETRNLPDPPERRQGGGEKNALVLELDGEPAGYALYRIHMKFESRAAAGHVDVIEAVADGPARDARALARAARHGLEGDVKAYLLPIDHPLVHQLTYPRRMRCGRGRPVGAPRRRRRGAVGARVRRRGPGRVRARGCVPPENAGRWRIAGGGAERTEDEPDLALGIGELGSVYLGGFGFGELVRAGSCDELEGGGSSAVRTPSSASTRRSPGAPRSSDLPATKRQLSYPPALAPAAPTRGARCAARPARPGRPRGGRPRRPDRRLSRAHPAALTGVAADGTLTDGYGPRWGRMHLGLDVGILRRSTYERLRAAQSPPPAG